MGVTKATVDSALADVIDELYAAGLYSEKIADVEVYVEAIDLIGYEGLFYEEPGRMAQMTFVKFLQNMMPRKKVSARHFG
jgi:hypothetical protein